MSSSKTFCRNSLDVFFRAFLKKFMRHFFQLFVQPFFYGFLYEFFHGWSQGLPQNLYRDSYRTSIENYPWNSSLSTRDCSLSSFKNSKDLFLYFMSSFFSKISTNSSKLHLRIYCNKYYNNYSNHFSTNFFKVSVQCVLSNSFWRIRLWSKSLEINS